MTPGPALCPRCAQHHAGRRKAVLFLLCLRPAEPSTCPCGRLLKLGPTLRSGSLKAVWGDRMCLRGALSSQTAVTVWQGAAGGACPLRAWGISLGRECAVRERSLWLGAQGIGCGRQDAWTLAEGGGQEESSSSSS